MPRRVAAAPGRRGEVRSPPAKAAAARPPRRATSAPAKAGASAPAIAKEAGRTADLERRREKTKAGA